MPLFNSQVNLTDYGFQDLIEHLQETLPILPDESIRELVDHLEITLKDAKTIVALDDGERLDYFHEVTARLRHSMGDSNSTHDSDNTLMYRKMAKTAANWSVEFLLMHTLLCTLNIHQGYARAWWPSDGVGETVLRESGFSTSFITHHRQLTRQRDHWQDSQAALGDGF